MRKSVESWYLAQGINTACVVLSQHLLVERRLIWGISGPPW
jgi:hypothetical protein